MTETNQRKYYQHADYQREQTIAANLQQQTSCLVRSKVQYIFCHAVQDECELILEFRNEESKKRFSGVKPSIIGKRSKRESKLINENRILFFFYKYAAFYLNLLASLSDSKRTKTSPSLTGPLTFLTIELKTISKSQTLIKMNVVNK